MQTASTTSRLMSFALAAVITFSVMLGLDSQAAHEAAAPQMAKAACTASQV